MVQHFGMHAFNRAKRTNYIRIEGASEINALPLGIAGGSEIIAYPPGIAGVSPAPGVADKIGREARQTSWTYPESRVHPRLFGNCGEPFQPVGRNPPYKNRPIAWHPVNPQIPKILIQTTLTQKYGIHPESTPACPIRPSVLYSAHPGCKSVYTPANVSNIVLSTNSRPPMARKKTKADKVDIS